MNRNAEEHYAQVPHANIQRSKFKRDFAELTTLNEGELIPIYCDEVLPADTFSINMNALVRMSTPLYPVMDNAYMDFYFFFVPCRLLWEHFPNMLGQNDSSYWAEQVEYTTPKTIAPEGGWEVGTLADYFGIPTGVPNIKVNSMPFRAYCKIFNEWFRDENLEQPLTMSKGDETTQGVNGKDGTSEYWQTRCEKGGTPATIDKFHDYFTSCLPAPQKGTSINIPSTGVSNISWNRANGTKLEKVKSYGAGEMASEDILKIGNISYALGYNRDLSEYGETNSIAALQGATTSSTTGTETSDVWYLRGENSAVTINELRQAIAVQHILERDARTGTRYKEILQGAWGVTSPDARLDRSEYIGGKRIAINVNQVIQTSSTNTSSPQGNTAAYSMTTMSNDICTYSATEHGYVIGLAAVRVDHSYQQGLSRMWTRSTRFSYYDPMLANLGEQAVLNQEIYAQGTSEDEEVFGYQEAWADYRYRTNMITGEMRSSYKESLDAWHYADYYTELPKLSATWIEEPKDLIDRTLAVSSEVSHQFICNFYFDQTWTRAMPIYSLPGLDTI